MGAYVGSVASPMVVGGPTAHDVITDEPAAQSDGE